MAEIELNENNPRHGSNLAIISWNDGALKKTLEDYFRPQDALSAGNPELDTLFTARNFKAAGINIKWTHNLVSHLNLGCYYGVPTVEIFHCMSFLEIQKSSVKKLYPASLIQETLDTLHLLFPASDKETRDWLQDYRPIGQLDLRLACNDLKDQDRKFGHFRYWHDRLVLLKRAFDENYQEVN
ncbi:hypothetical protein TrVFT333_008102 [Trichoderma virens FT-333]|nr:hypothetical protein TrVFT333_008102 [Trichoderma virens FT-333]